MTRFYPCLIRVPSVAKNHSYCKRSAMFVSRMSCQRRRGAIDCDGGARRAAATQGRPSCPQSLSFRRFIRRPLSRSCARSRRCEPVKKTLDQGCHCWLAQQCDPPPRAALLDKASSGTRRADSASTFRPDQASFNCGSRSQSEFVRQPPLCFRLLAVCNGRGAPCGEPDHCQPLESDGHEDRRA